MQSRTEPFNALESLPLSAQLRQETRTAHHRLEQTPAMRHLMSTGLTRTSYAQLLRVWSGGWLPLENALRRHTPNGVSELLAPAPRAPQLEADVKLLAPGLPPLLPAGALPEAGGARWYGLAYVVQGSLIGNTVVAAHLERQLGLGPEQGAAFFSGVQPLRATAAPSRTVDWRTWLSALDAEVTCPRAQRLAVHTARKTFNYLTDHFSAHSGWGHASYDSADRLPSIAR